MIPAVEVVEKYMLADWGDAIMAALCVGFLLFGAGWVAHERYVAHKPKPLALVQRIEAKPANYMRWSCDKQEFNEYVNACTRRAANEKIK